MNNQCFRSGSRFSSRKLLLSHAFVSSLVPSVLESSLRMLSKFSVLRIRIWEPVLFLPPDPGSEMGKNLDPRSGMNISYHF
jgi:hypothetical protein